MSDLALCRYDCGRKATIYLTTKGNACGAGSCKECYELAIIRETAAPNREYDADQDCRDNNRLKAKF